MRVWVRGFGRVSDPAFFALLTTGFARFSLFVLAARPVVDSRRLQGDASSPDSGGRRAAADGNWWSTRRRGSPFGFVFPMRTV
jgi:hypothetical protein